MRKIFQILLIAFLIVSCTNGKKKQSITESPFKSSVLSEEFSKFIKDVKLIEKPQLPPLYTIKFIRDKNEELLMIFLDLSFPTHIPSPINDSIVLRGICFVNDMPVIIYDKINGIGYEYYDTTQLNTDTLEYFKKKYDPELVKNNIDYPTWIYRITSNGGLQLLKKTPMNKIK